jgi:hypothetical protein
MRSTRLLAFLIVLATAACGSSSGDTSASCESATARAAALCPTYAADIKAACSGSAPVACVTECMAAVNSCADVTCSFCLTCDCAGDSYGQCMQQCAAAH